MIYEITVAVEDNISESGSYNKRSHSPYNTEAGQAFSGMANIKQSQSKTPRIPIHDPTALTDTTMDITQGPRASSGDRSLYNYNSSHLDLKQLLLDEREKRLTI